MMMENVVGRLLIVNESYRWDLCQVERLNSELLVQVMVLEATWDHPIVIPDSPPLLSLVVLSGKLGGLPTELELLVCPSPNR